MDLTPHGWIALGTLATATFLFIKRPIPLPITAFAIPVVLRATGVLSETSDALAGFGNHAVIAIGAIFVVGAGLRESGVATLIARGLQRVGGSHEFGLVILMMSATAILAAFMNNTAVVAILLPVGMALARRADLAPSRLLMPISFAAVLGGTISMIGTAPNFIVSDLYNRGPYDDEIGVFDFANVGIPITVVGVLFMAIFGRKLLPTIKTEDRLAAARLPEQVASSYGVPDKLFMIRIAKASGICGVTIAEAGIRSRYGLDIVMIRRGSALGQRWLQPDPNVRFEAEDHLYVSGPDEAAWDLCESEMLQFGLADDKAMDEIMSHGTTLAEVTFTPHSPALGRTFKDLDFRKRFGLNVLALFRGQAVQRERLAEVELQLGDAFLVSGSTRRVRDLARDPDFVVLTDQSQVEDVTRAPLAVAILLLAILPPVLLGFPLPISAMGAAILMILTRCVSRSGLQRAMDWGVLCLIIGTLPLGKALQETGIADQAAGLLTALTSSQIVLFGLLFVLGAAFSMLASNAAAAVIVAPVALAAAETLSIDPKAALLAMAYGCSCNFIVPYSQCNLIVMAPGGYKAGDFLRAGIALSFVMAATTIATLAILG
jgi:di/tricarboxylate transporter